MRQITCHTHSSPFICNSDHMTSPRDRCVTHLDWHFNPGSINCHFAVREYLELMTTGDDSQALFDRPSSHRVIIVDNDAERAANEVPHQQVGTVASKLVEATIKRHEMLSTSQAGVTCVTQYKA